MKKQLKLLATKVVDLYGYTTKTVKITGLKVIACNYLANVYLTGSKT